MRLTLGHQGDWVVDPCELSPRLGVNADYLKRMERPGHVDAWIKTDDDSGTGQTRVAVRLRTGAGEAPSMEAAPLFTKRCGKALQLQPALRDCIARP